jgi:multicomponent Na+:H+ antiporter subunit G
VSTVADVVSAALAIVGALLGLVAAVGLLRLGDTRSRMHAATKPATLGVLCCAIAVVLQADDLSAVSKALVIVVLQLVTAPVGAHMLARSITRAGRGADDQR